MVDAAEATGMQKGSRGRGRKDGDGGEEVPDYDVVNKDKKRLMKLYKEKEESVAAYNDACKKTAKDAHLNTPSIKLLIKSSATGDFKEVQRILDQRSTLFEIVGEVPGGAVTGGDD